MSLKDFFHNRWTGFVFWALLYVLWVIWLGNYWWLLGLIVIFDIFITKKVHWNFWKKRYKEGEKRSAANDWLDDIIFAVVFVTFLNIFFFQAFKIPSSSMESTLYTGDHLFVSKLTYGPKLPQTPLTVPFTHNTIFGKESYSRLITRDYKRLKGFREVQRGDNVVFCFPNGDTVLVKAPADDYYMLSRIVGRETAIKNWGPVKVRPSDKKDHYVKRCVAVAGDRLEIIDDLVYVNGQKQEVYPGIQLTYKVVTSNGRINQKFFEKLGLNTSELFFDPALPGYPAMPLTEEMLSEVRDLDVVQRAQPRPRAQRDGAFPVHADGLEPRLLRSHMDSQERGDSGDKRGNPSVLQQTHQGLRGRRRSAGFDGRQVYLPTGLLFHDGGQQAQFPGLKVLGLRS